MSCSCISTTRTPGTPTSGSGYASRLVKNAIQCDQARVLYNLRNMNGSGNGCACTKPTSKSAVYSSILEQQAATGCNNLLSNNQTSASNTQNTLNLPKSAIPQSVRIQQIIDQTNQNSLNQTNPNTRFNAYTRIIPIPCPISTEFINSVLPKPSMNGPCRVFSASSSSC